MEMQLLHQQSVPCLSKLKKSPSGFGKEGLVYYLNPHSLLRYDPNGLIIVPQKFEQLFLYADKELSVLFRNRELLGKDLPKSSIEVLTHYGVISEKAFEEENHREYYVCTADLPVHALLDVTTKCNCNCLMCYHKEDLHGYEPPLKDVLKRLENLKRLGILSVEITGGEALLRKDLYNILEKAAELDLNYYFVTNGEYLRNLDTEILRLIGDSKHSLGVVVSLDAVGGVHDMIRGRPGLFQKVLDGLDLVRENGIDVELVSTVFDCNAEHMQQIISIARKYGVRVQFRPSLFTGAAKANGLHGASMNDNMRALLEEGGVVNNFIGEHKSIVPSRYYGCNSLMKISVDAHGNIFPCVMDRSRALGNIVDCTQEELRVNLLQEIKYFLVSHDKCRKCGINAEKMICGGFCRFSKSYKNK